MGRGRAKAKQTKVARELKYSSHETDFDALQRELSNTGSTPHSAADADDEESSDEGYRDYADEGDEDYPEYRR